MTGVGWVEWNEAHRDFGGPRSTRPTLQETFPESLSGDRLAAHGDRRQGRPARDAFHELRQRQEPVEQLHLAGRELVAAHELPADVPAERPEPIEALMVDHLEPRPLELVADLNGGV